MDTVVNESNFCDFTNDRIHAILPRTIPFQTRLEFSLNGKWAAYSLKEFEDVFCNEEKKLHGEKINVLIDVANGHMKKIFDLVKASKKIYNDEIIIMVGNIANPSTYEKYAEVGADYVRCGIGSGFGCLSTSNTGIHMPMASLISKIAEQKKQLSDKYAKLPRIIADGGIRNYSDIIKALALGADYVMCGSIFSKMIESAAQKIYNDEGLVRLSPNAKLMDVEDLHIENGNWCGIYNGRHVSLGEIKATFYGMASREGQIALNGSKTKTSEGVKKTLIVEYTLHGWCENFIDYLRSAMSYVGSKTLYEFRENTVLIINSENAINAVNK